MRTCLPRLARSSSLSSCSSRRASLLPLLLAFASAWSLPGPAAAQAAPLIRMDDAHMRQAGVAFQGVKPASGAGERLRLPGTVIFSGKGQALVSAPAAGVVQAILVQPMQSVAAGRAVVLLHSPQVLEWQREFIQATAQSALTADKLKRDQALFDEGIVARSRLEETRNAHLQAQADWQEHQQLLRLAGFGDAALRRLATDKTLNPEISIVARHAGVVSEQTVSVGQRVDAGAPLLTLARSGELLLELQASRAQAARIALGSAVQVAGCDGAGRVIAKGLAVNPANQSVSIRSSMPGADKCLRANQHVEAEIAGAANASASAFVVPASALLRHEGREYVLVREPGGVQPVAVTPTGRSGDALVVTGPLSANASVAVQGIAALKGSWAGLGNNSGAPK